MSNFVVQLETITPLFLSGAEARGDAILREIIKNEKKRYELIGLSGGEPELRPPAFRGALRYWLRAITGGMIGDELTILHDTESSVYGSASSAHGMASVVQVRLRESQMKSSEIFKKGPTVQVNKNNQYIPQPTGRDYLYWSMAESGVGRKDKYQPPKKYFPEGCYFDLVLSSRFGGELALQRAVVSVWLLVHFGGIGSRSRRTGGSMSVKKPTDFMGLAFDLHSDTPQQIATDLLSGLRTAQGLMNLESKPSTLMLNPPFDVLSLNADIFQVWVLGPWKTSQEAVEAIGASMRDFRTYSSPDHEEVAKWLNGNSINTVQRSIFGLPIPYKYSNGGPEGVIQGKTSKPGEIDRRASPLWLKISKTANNQYVVIATLFKSAFLPAGEKLMLSNVKNATHNNPPSISPPSNYQLVENWIDTMRSNKAFVQVAEVVT